MAPRDRWTDGPVRLHYLDSGADADPGLVPLLLVPGLSSTAEDSVALIEALAPRRCVAFSHRGRGRSDAPEHGYALEDHVEDIREVVRSALLQAFCLHGHSRGVSYAIAFAALHPWRVTGLIVGDYPPHHTELLPEWVEPFWQGEWLGRRIPERMSRHALEAIQRESAYIPLAEGLKRVRCPALVLRGTEDGSLMPSTEAARYLRNLSDARLVELHGSGHVLWEPDPGPYVAAIREFLEGLDRLRRGE